MRVLTFVGDLVQSAVTLKEEELKQQVTKTSAPQAKKVGAKPSATKKKLVVDPEPSANYESEYTPVGSQKEKNDDMWSINSQPGESKLKPLTDLPPLKLNDTKPREATTRNVKDIEIEKNYLQNSVDLKTPEKISEDQDKWDFSDNDDTNGNAVLRKSPVEQNIPINLKKSASQISSKI